MKYRVKFSKTGKIRFIGHLDLLKTFQRAIKRAELPVAYSNGFNPHQLIGFAIPLPLGMASVGEYFDIDFKQELSNCEIISKLNSVLPDGLEIISSRKLSVKDKNCASSVSAALYEIYLPDKIDSFSDIINNIIAQDYLNIERTSKRKTKIIDIKPYIFSIEEILENSCTVFKALIATGSQNNLKPELLVKYIYNYIKKEYVPFNVSYKRVELFSGDKDNFLSL